MNDRYLTILPSAGRLMSSLRDIGYDVASAVADLVDNSIDAGAENVSVDLVAEGPTRGFASVTTAWVWQGSRSTKR